MGFGLNFESNGAKRSHIEATEELLLENYLADSRDRTACLSQWLGYTDPSRSSFAGAKLLGKLERKGLSSADKMVSLVYNQDED